MRFLDRFRSQPEPVEEVPQVEEETQDTSMLAVPMGQTESGAIDVTGYSGGLVFIPEAWSPANLGFKTAPELGGTYVILRDLTGTPVQISGIEGSRAYPLPPEVGECSYVIFWSKDLKPALEADVVQDNAHTLYLKFKGGV